jgi:hypothetical protein
MAVDLKEIQRRMRPGAWDTAGFLSEDDSLEVVLDQDGRVLEARGLTAEALGARLSGLLEAAEGSDLARPARSEQHEVEIVRQRGLITCPWAAEEFEACSAGAGARPTANRFSIVNRASRHRLEGFELSGHLIRDHGFFGGPGTRFRLDPQDVADVLGISPRGNEAPL